MQECFESRDIAQLQTVLSKLPRDEAALHLDRCIKSGLWVPNAKDAEEEEDEEAAAGNQESEQDEQKKVTDDVKKLQVQ
jgi:cell division cycle protein 37